MLTITKQNPDCKTLGTLTDKKEKFFFFKYNNQHSSTLIYIDMENVLLLLSFRFYVD